MEELHLHTHDDLPASVQKTLEAALAAYEAAQLKPACNQGHGDLDLARSKAGKLYWRCSCPGCDSHAPYRELSKELCPFCKKPFAKVPSRKVRGGNFLVCLNQQASEHGENQEILAFRDFESGNWKVIQKLQTYDDHGKESESSHCTQLEKTKVLSAIARMNGIPGGHHPDKLWTSDDLIAHLRGKHSTGVAVSLESTRGVLESCTAEEVHWILDSLIDEDCVRFHPSTDSMHITEKGMIFLLRQKAH